MGADHSTGSSLADRQTPGRTHGQTAPETAAGYQGALDAQRRYTAGEACDHPVFQLGAGYAASERFTVDNIDAAMQYHPWTRDQVEAGDIVRDALTMAAKAILRHVPDGPYRAVAIRKLLEARMDANAAITFRGRF